MRRWRYLLFFVGLFCLIIPYAASAQVLSPVASAEGSFDADTQAFFIGKTQGSIEFSGYPLDPLLGIPLLEDVEAVPLLGRTRIVDVDSVRLVDLQDFENLSDFEGLLIDLNITRFDDVTVHLQNAPYLLGFDNGTMSADLDVPYAISGVVSYELNQQSIPFVVVLSTADKTLGFNGDFCFVSGFQSSDQLPVTITSSSGSTVWSGDMSSKLILIDDEDFELVQETPVSLVPLVSSDEMNKSFTYRVRPAEAADADISSVFDAVSDTTATMETFNIGDFSEILDEFDSLLSAASSMINGAMVLMGEQNTIMVDGSKQQFSQVVFARSDHIDVMVDSAGESFSFSVTGRYRLLLLDDHLYTVQAQDSDAGVAFPIALVAVWILALGVFLLFRFYLKTSVNEKRDTLVKQYGLYIHIAALVITFILMDREISFQFGLSAIDALVLEGVSLILGLFLLVEVVVWVLGYLALSIPVRLITESGLKLVGVGKGGKGVAKAVGIVFIWVFAALYVKLLINVLLSVVGVGELFPV